MLATKQQQGGCSGRARRGWQRVAAACRRVSVEPLMLLDGLAFSNMHVYIENLQMDRVCRVTCGFSQEVCSSLKSHSGASVEVQQRYSVFALYNGIIAAALPLFFILFMGAWSDKYGRKVPLLAVQLGHVLHAAGYLLVSLMPAWPAEVLLLVTFLDSLGGGAVSFLTAANSYIGDVSSEETRTSRVGLANSIWFLGGPVGTLLGTYIYKWGGYLPLFATSLTFSLAAVVYVLLCLPESHGPFASQSLTGETSSKNPVGMRKSVEAVYGLEVKAPLDAAVPPAPPSLSTMVKDFFNPRRIVDSFTSTLKPRQGNMRTLILLLIFTSLLRRLTRSPYVFAFSRHELHWHATDYSLWVTYKNLMATTGSLVAVPLLSGRLGVPDNLLAMVGATSGILEYVLYGCVSQYRSFLMWIGPMAALLVNSCTIAQRAMMTKFVATDEIGKVSAVLGALDGMMPMVNSALFTAVYHASVASFPAAHFFLGASAGGLMILFFCLLMKLDKFGQYNVESAKMATGAAGPVINRSLVMRTNSLWVTSDALALAMAAPNTRITQQREPEPPSSPPSPSWPQHLLQRLKTSVKVIRTPASRSSTDEAQAGQLRATPGLTNLILNINKIVTDSITVNGSQQNKEIDQSLPPV